MELKRGRQFAAASLIASLSSEPKLKRLLTATLKWDTGFTYPKRGQNK